MLTDPFPPLSRTSAAVLARRSSGAAPRHRGAPSLRQLVTMTPPSSSPSPPRPPRRFPCSNQPLDSHFGQVRRPRRRPYSSPARSAARPSCRCRQAASRAEPDHLSPRIIPQIPVNPCNFCKRAPEFYLNQPAVLISSKIISFRSFSLCSSPGPFTKLPPPSSLHFFPI